MPKQQETSEARVLTPEQFLARLESTDECFPLTGGTFGARGETEKVLIADYHAPVSDFFDNKKLNRHIQKGAKAPIVELPLEITVDFKYAFDPGEEWFCIARGAFLHISGRRIPVRVVQLYNFTDYKTIWLYRDEGDQG